MYRTLLIAAFTILAGCSKSESGAGGAASQKPAQTRPTKELIFNTYLPPIDPIRMVAVDDFSRRIEQESNGTIKVSIPDSTLAPANRQWAVVTDGVADIAVIANHSQRETLSLPLIADLAFNSISGEAASVALWNTQKKYFDGINEYADVKLLSMFSMPPFSINSTKPINGFGNFTGMKIWVSAGAQTETIKALGAIPVFSPYPQLFEYASKGNVDAVMVGPGTIKTASIGDYVKYMSRIPGGFGATSFSVIMNKNTWASLSADQQAAIQRAAEDLPRRVGRLLDERNEEALHDLKLTVKDLDAGVVAEVRKRVAPVEAAWIDSAAKRGLANPAGVLAAYRSEMAAVAQAAATTPPTSTPAAQATAQ